jgi:hypothetical protein
MPKVYVSGNRHLTKMMILGGGVTMELGGPRMNWILLGLLLLSQTKLVVLILRSCGPPKSTEWL